LYRPGLHHPSSKLAAVVERHTAWPRASLHAGLRQGGDYFGSRLVCGTRNKRAERRSPILVCLLCPPP
jgi:hypothetical protein